MKKKRGARNAECGGKQFFIFFAPLRLCVSLIFLFILGCGENKKSFVVIYTSQDQIYAEPIFQEFTKKTGTKIRVVYDSEAVKTVGLVNRLIAEKNHPQCDVFWNNEEFRTRQLKKKGILRETNSWESFGFRKRQLVINTNQFTNPN
ncbi:MAG: hypothetical protein ACR2H1_08565, partial [Limisphaerales bacterium]